MECLHYVAAHQILQSIDDRTGEILFQESCLLLEAGVGVVSRSIAYQLSRTYDRVSTAHSRGYGVVPTPHNPKAGTKCE